MPDPTALGDLVAVYAVALLFIVALARLRVPPIVALILAGVVAGPHGFRLVATQAEVDLFAEIGVVLLLFTVGLDFSATEIRRYWRPVLVGGTLQVVLTTGLTGVLASVAVGAVIRPLVFIGLFVALSSTAIVIKAFAERNQLNSPAGRLSVGILLFQDLCIIALLLMVPILAGRIGVGGIPLALGRAALALALVAGVGRLVLPIFIRWVTRSGRREAFPLAILLASVGTAWASSLLGVSMALGAFLGGLVLAESEFSHQAYAEVRPLRDILGSLFFVSIGMLVDPSFVATRLLPVLAAAAAIIGLKAVVATLALLAVGTSLRVALTAGIALAQVGEFSFILGRAGLDAGIIDAGVWQILLSASVVTMLVAPALVAAAPLVAAALVAAAGRRRDATPSDMPELSDHVVVLGYGVGGQLLARALREVGVPYLILELNGATVRLARAEGERIFYGDAANADTLRAAGVERARAVVVVLSDPDASLRALRSVRQIAPAAPVIVRTRYRLEAERMLRAGASVAVAEELEASLEVVAQLLARSGVPGNLLQPMLDVLRREGGTVRAVTAPRPPLGTLPGPIGRLPVESYRLTGGEWAIGRTLAEIDLRASTGALVIAVDCGGRHVTSPATDVRLQQEDVLYLVGDESDLVLARRRLTTGQ